jgi:hypothetical protein
MIKLVDLLRENIKNNIVNDAKTLSKEDFLEKYSAEFKKFGTYEPHGYISTNNNQPYIRLNDKTIESSKNRYTNLICKRAEPNLIKRWKLLRYVGFSD